MDISRPFLDQLGREYRTRRARNAAYSLRSFSRDLNVGSGRLSQYFSGQRSVTPKAAHRIMNRLGLSPVEQAHWLGLSLAQASIPAPSAPELLDQKVFELISEPIHFTLLSLMETRGFRREPRWIAARLRSSVTEVTHSLRLLQDLGLITEKDGKLTPTHAQGVRSSDGVQNAALRKAHRRQLEQAIEGLERIPLELRDITSITLAADPARLNEAKALIKDFRRKLAQLLERGKNPSEVYRLQIQLIPLTELSPIPNNSKGERSREN
ncbi:MAG: DUF4423 domain-containing protein [Oligoflexia bacterium]|nr:DUF4423 domain-containing protein [Oligoflexia bacterium]